jgi:hypothetical protein
MKCPNRACDFEGTQDEINAHLHFGLDRRSEAEAHGFKIAEPCEECGNVISIGRDEVSHNHAETCSLHPRNVPDRRGSTLSRAGPRRWKDPDRRRPPLSARA